MSNGLLIIFEIRPRSGVNNNADLLLQNAGILTDTIELTCAESSVSNLWTSGMIICQNENHS